MAGVRDGLPCRYGRGVQHHAGIAASIHLVDLRPAVQVDGGVACPAVLAKAGTIDGGGVARSLVRPYGTVDVHRAVKRAAIVVVTAIEGAGHRGIITVVVQRSLVDVAGHIVPHAVGTGKDVLGLDGRA